jgi:hypothetical protein
VSLPRSLPAKSIRKFVYQLLNRGFEFSCLLSLVITIGKIDRDKLIPYKNKIDLIKPIKSYYFDSEFNKFLPNCNKLLLESFDSQKCNYYLVNYGFEVI